MPVISPYTATPLISKTASCGERRAYEPLAEPADNGLHSFKSLTLGAAQPAFMSYCLGQQRNTPQNLRSHVQRINLCISQGDASASYAALLDLFIILNSHGLALRTRMLEQAKPLLKESDYAALSACLHDVNAIENLAYCELSLFAKARFGDQPMINRRASLSAVDPMLLYCGHMECGELDDAQRVLQQACLDGARDIELHKELIELLQALHADNELLNVAQQIIAQQPEHDAIAHLWRQQINAIAAYQQGVKQ